MSLTKCLIAMFSRSRSMSEARRFFLPEARVMVVMVLSIVACLLMTWRFVQELHVSTGSADTDVPLILALVHLAFTFGSILSLLSCLNTKVSTDQYAWCLRLFRLRASLGLPLPQRSMTKKDLLDYVVLAHEAENSTKMLLAALNRQ